MNCAVALSDRALTAKRVIIVADMNIALSTINHSFSFDEMDEDGLEIRGFGKNTQQSNITVE